MPWYSVFGPDYWHSSVEPVRGFPDSFYQWHWDAGQRCFWVQGLALGKALFTPSLLAKGGWQRGFLPTQMRIEYAQTIAAFDWIAFDRASEQSAEQTGLVAFGTDRYLATLSVSGEIHAIVTDQQETDEDTIILSIYNIEFNADPGIDIPPRSGLWKYTGLVDVEVPDSAPPAPPPGPYGGPNPWMTGQPLGGMFDRGIQPGSVPNPGARPPARGGNAGNRDWNIWDLDRLADWMAANGLGGVKL